MKVCCLLILDIGNIIATDINCNLNDAFQIKKVNVYCKFILKRAEITRLKLLCDLLRNKV